MLKSTQQKMSDKLHVIDRVTFEKISREQNKTNYPSKRIKNSKYKKTRTVYNLFHFLTQKSTETAAERRRNKLTKKRVLHSRLKQPLKKRGKTRECGRSTKHSRLKKSILRYRQQKRLQEKEHQDHVMQVVDGLQELTLTVSIQQSTLAPPLEKEDNKVVGLHSRRFRSYCDNYTTDRLCELTEQLLRELDRFQKRALSQNEIKARGHRRFVVGFREVLNYLRINKSKLVIIAPDCEVCTGEAGLDETIANVKVQCQNQQIPYIFSLRRRQLSYALYKKVPISCVAILDYNGAREIYSQLLQALREAKYAFQDKVQTKQTEIYTCEEK